MNRQPTVHSIAAATLFGIFLAISVALPTPRLMAAQYPLAEEPFFGDSLGAESVGEKDDNRVQVMVELAMPPAAVVYAEQSVHASSADQVAATQAHLAAVDAAQLSRCISVGAT